MNTSIKSESILAGKFYAWMKHMYSRFNKVQKHFIFIFLILTCNIKIANAAIIIQSIAVTPSTCENNGVAIVSAISTKPNPILLYEIITGPSVTVIQNSPVFSSLFPGTYTLRTYDADFAYTDQQFTIDGNYQLPDLTPIAINPLCTSQTDGKILGHPVEGKGYKPFVWELTSSAISIKQSSDVFSNLPLGSYSIKMTDACGNYQTRTVELISGGTGLAHASDGIPSIYKSGCKTMVFNMPIKIFKENAKNPITLTIHKANGVQYVKTIYPIAVDTINYAPGIYSIVDTVSNVTYGDYLYACIKDICGKEICSTRDTIAPFDFDISFNTTLTACNSKLTATVNPKSIIGKSYIRTGFHPPLSLIVYDLATNTRVDSTGCNTTYCGIVLKEQISGKFYRIEITDGCGTVFRKNIEWPPPILNPASVQVGIGLGCMDSTAVAYFNLVNFGSIVTIKLLSGPTRVGSTKTDFTFSDQITYPKTFAAGLISRYSIKNLPAGIYTYSAADTCGNTVTGSFEIKPSSLADFKYSYSIKNGCIGNNILHFNPISPNAIAAFIKDPITNQELYKRIGTLTPDSLISPGPGNYLLQIYYGNVPNITGNSYNAAITNGSLDCWVLNKIISIPPYSNTIFKSHTSIFCNGISYVEIKIDSTHGLPPYQFEIISGPQLFPLQNSNVFQLPTYGDYTIRIRDACGNSTARQISVDSSKFAPIAKIGATCRGNKIILKAISSTFFTYEWQKPDGSLYIGDSLIINALSPSDTGVYSITKNVNINNCTDLFKASYHIELNDVYNQSISFCEGTSVNIGTHMYNKSGIYADTLINSAGCDSIVISTLYMIPQKIDTNSVRICNGEHIIVGTNTYDVPGIYKDSVQNTNGCYDITITQLEVNGFPDTSKIVICQGSNFQIGIHLYTKSGIYTDTLISSLGCDSIRVTDLTVLPIKRTTLTQTICEGESVIVGIHSYNQTGIYIDTLTTVTCDSIVTLDLIMKPYVRNSISKSICSGENISIGLHTYTETGIYSDTLHTTTCDSIVTLALTVHPLPAVFLGKDTSLCAEQSLTLDGGNGFISYQWNDGAFTSSQFLLVNTVGTYWVKVEDPFGCTNNDTIAILNIYPLPTADAGPNVRQCYGYTTELSATGGIDYLWMPDKIQQQTISVNPTSTMTYQVTVTDIHHCSASDDVEVFVYSKPLPLLPQTPIVYCFDDGTVKLTANWGESFVWKPSGETTQSIQIYNEGTYTVTAKDVNQCSYSENIIVDEYCDTKLFLPSAFSPNGDGLNDEFEIFGKNLAAFKITIFNRWGEVIFLSTDKDIRWDGKYKGDEIPIGTYPWTISYQNIFDEKHSAIILNGSVTVVR